MNRSLRLAVCVAAASYALQATAQTQIEETVVTATRDNAVVATLPMTVQVIDKKQLLAQISVGENLSDALGKLVPGMGVSTDVATEFSQNLRGRRVLYLIDGVPQRDNRNISRFLHTVSPRIVERIEVVSTSSALYGVGGAGGIINIITARGQQGMSASLRAEMLVNDGNLTDRSLSLNVSGANSGWDYLVNLTGEARKAQYDANGDRIAPEPAQTSRHDADSLSGFIKLGFEPTETSRFDLSLDYYRDEQDTDYGPNFGGPGIPALLQRTNVESVAVPGLALDTQPESERQAIQISYQSKDLLGQQVQLQAYHRQRQYRFFPFPGLTNINLQQPFATLLQTTQVPVLYVNQSESEATVQGFRATVTSELNKQLSLTWGADLSRDEGEQSAWGYDLNTYIATGGLNFVRAGDEYAYGPEVTTDSRALFANAKWSLSDAVTVRAGVRYEDISADVAAAVSPIETLFLRQYGSQVAQLQGLGLLTGDTDPVAIGGGNIDDQQWLFNGGISYRLTAAQTLFANYSQGFELPDYARLLRDGVADGSVLESLASGVQTASVDDTELEAIDVESIEMGWRMAAESVDASVAVFLSESNKTTVFNSDYTVDMLDQDKRIWGTELAVAWQMAPQWRVGGSYTYTAGETTLANNTDQALPISEVPPAKTSAFAQWLDGPASVRLQALHVHNDSRAHNDNAREAIAEAYTTVDLSGRYEFSFGTVEVMVNNAFNEQYQTVYSQWAEAVYGSFAGVSARGRTISMAYTLAF